MEINNIFSTPNKTKSTAQPPIRPAPNHMFHTPKSNGFHSGALAGKSTPGCLQRKPGILQLINAIHSPQTRVTKIINPFEAALAERLHLPMICSPSLFQTQSNASTPQHSSSQFEWTIDDVSSLNPANVEVHETQFMSVTDPELEARAQAAINSFFKEQVIVPSPIDCQLRNQKIIFQNESQLMQQRKRDGSSQTILTLPPILPKEVEEILKPYFSFNVDQQQTPSKDCDTTIDHDARDASLRRKLFNQSLDTTGSGEVEHFELNNLSPPPKSPKSRLLIEEERNFHSPEDKLRNSLNMSTNTTEKNSFGSLSPISNPNISKLTLSLKSNRSYLSTSSIFQSTPERPLSICRTYSDTSMNTSAKRQILVNSNHMHTEEDIDSHHHSSSNSDDFESNEDCPMNLSSHSSQRTPTSRRRRTINRKNLSQSFLSMSQDDFAIDHCDVLSSTATPADQIIPQILSQTDSGFTEMEIRDIRQHQQKQNVFNYGGAGHMAM